MPTNNVKKVDNWDEDVVDSAPKKVDNWDEDVTDSPKQATSPNGAGSGVPNFLQAPSQSDSSTSNSETSVLDLGKTIKANKPIVAQVEPKFKAEQIRTLKNFAFNKEQALKNAETVAPIEREASSTAEDLYKSFEAGNAKLGSMLAKTPAFIYDLGAVPQNLVSKYTGINLGASSKGLAEQLNLPENEVAKYYDEAYKQAKVNIDAKYDKSISDYIDKGEYGKAIKSIANQVMESAPISISLMAGNAAGVTPMASTIGGAAVFGADNKAELDKNNPNMDEATKTLNAAGKGLMEGVFENALGVTKLGTITRNVLEKEGAEAAKEVAEKSFKEIYAPVLKKYIGIGFEEPLGEAATQFSQNVIAKYSGENPDLDLTDGVADAAIVGLGSGVAFSAPVAAIDLIKSKDARVKAKDLQAKKDAIESDLSNHSIPNEVKDVLSEQAKEINANLADLHLEDNVATEGLNEEDKAKVETNNKAIDNFETVIGDLSLSEDSRKIIEEKKNELEKQNEEILNGNRVVEQQLESPSAENGGGVGKDNTTEIAYITDEQGKSEPIELSPQPSELQLEEAYNDLLNQSGEEGKKRIKPIAEIVQEVKDKENAKERVELWKTKVAEARKVFEENQSNPTPKNPTSEVAETKTEPIAEEQKVENKKIFTYDKDGNIIEAEVLSEGKNTSSILIDGKQTIRSNAEIFSTEKDAKDRIQNEQELTHNTEQNATKQEQIKTSVQGERENGNQIGSEPETSSSDSVLGAEKSAGQEEVKFVTHNNEIVSGKKLTDAINKVADDMVEGANKKRNEHYASHITEKQKDEFLAKDLKYAEEVRQGKHLANLTIAQRINYELTGESVPILPKQAKQELLTPNNKQDGKDALKDVDGKIRDLEVKIKGLTDERDELDNGFKLSDLGKPRKNGERLIEISNQTTKLNNELGDLYKQKEIIYSENVKKTTNDLLNDNIKKEVQDLFLKHATTLEKHRASNFRWELDGYEDFDREPLRKNEAMTIADNYHKAKADGSNPELVKAVEDLLTNTNNNEVENENGIPKGGKARVENDTEGVQGNGEKGGQDVNKQEKVSEPQPKPVSKESGKKEKAKAVADKMRALADKLKSNTNVSLFFGLDHFVIQQALRKGASAIELSEKAIDGIDVFIKEIKKALKNAKIKYNEKDLRKEAKEYLGNVGIKASNAEQRERNKEIVSKKLAKTAKKYINATSDHSELGFVADYKESNPTTKSTDKEIGNAYVKARQESPKETRTATREAAFSDAKNTFKNSPRPFLEMISDGIAALKKQKGESNFDAAGRVVSNLYDRLSKNEKVAINTDVKGQLQYYMGALQAKRAEILLDTTKSIKDKAIELSAIEQKISDTEAVFGGVNQETARVLVMNQAELNLSREDKIAIHTQQKYRNVGGEPTDIAKKNELETQARAEFERLEVENKKLKEDFDIALENEVKKHLEGKEKGGISVEKPRQSFVERASKKLKDNPKLREIFNNKDRSQDIIEKVDKGRKEGKSIDEIVDELVDSKEISEGNAPKVKKFFREQEIEMAKEAGKIDNDMLREAVQKIIDSGVKREDIGIHEIVKNLKEDYFSDLTDKQIMDMITDYGKTKVLNEDPIASTIKYAKSVANLLSQIKDLENKILPPRKTEIRTELTPKEIADKKAEISELRKQVHGLMKNLPIDEATKANQLKTAQDRIGSFLENSILQLEKQIAEGVKTAINKRTVVYNEANKALLEKLNAVRAEFNNKFPKAEISTEERIRRAVKGIEKSERNYESRIAEGRFENKAKPEFTSPEIEIAKAKRDLRKAEFEKLKAESVPVKENTPQTRLDDALQAIKDHAAEKGNTSFTNEMVKNGLIDKLTDAYIENGVKAKDIESKIKEDLKESLPDLTEEDMRKAMLKIDEFKQQTKKEVETELQKQQRDLVSAMKYKQDIEDLLKHGEILKRAEARDKKAIGDYTQELKAQAEALKQQIKDAENALKQQIKEDEKARAQELKAQGKLKESILKKQGKDTKTIDAITELKRKQSKVENELRAWKQAIANPKKVPQNLAQARENLKQVLIARGITIGGESIKSKTILKAIGETLNKKIDDIKSNFTDAEKELRKESERLRTSDPKRSLELNAQADALAITDARLVTDRYDTAQKKQDLLNDNITKLKSAAKMLHNANVIKQGNELQKLIHGIEKEIETAQIDNATEKFIKQSETSTNKAKKNLAAGKFGEMQRAYPEINAVTIKADLARKKAELEFRKAEERYVFNNLSGIKQFTVGYLAARAKMLVSGAFVFTKLASSTVFRTGVESISHGGISPLLGISIGRNLKKALGNEYHKFSLDATKAAHSAIIYALRSKESVKAHLEESQTNYETAESEYKRNPSKENLAKLKDATFEYASNTMYSFVGASGYSEFVQMALGQRTALQKYFALDKGISAEEAKTGMEKFDFALETFGRLHGAVKNFSGRSAFMRAYTNNILNGMERGEPVQEATQQLIYAARSLQPYLEGTYQQKNAFMADVNSFISNLKKRPKGIGDDSQAMKEFAALAYKAEYPITKTPMNIITEAVWSNLLGLPRAIAMHGHQTIKAYNDTRFDNPEFKRDWAKVADKIASLPIDKADRIWGAYRQGGMGLMLGVMAAQGIIKMTNDDDDKLVIMGHTLGKYASNALTHVTYLMSADMVNEFNKEYDKAIEKDKSLPMLRALVGAAKHIVKESPYGHTSDIEHFLASFAPVPVITGDFTKLATGKDLAPRKAGEIIRNKIGMGLQDGIPERGSAQDKYRLTTEDLAQPKVIEFKNSQTFKHINADYQEEALAMYAAKTKKTKEDVAKYGIGEAKAKVMYAENATEVKNNIKEKQQEDIKYENLKKGLDKAKDEAEKIGLFNVAVRTKKIEGDKTKITYDSPSKREKKFDEWISEGLMTKEEKEILKEQLKNK